jgi:hypothetical protein
MDRKFIEGVLLRCVILGVVVLIIWFLFIVFAGGLAYDVHGSLFDEITVRQFEVIHYCGMGLLKLFVSVFFFIPYIAMRWKGKGQKPVD